MTFSFDLISDLHTDSDPHEFDWAGQQTSLYAVVVGDVARDRDTVVSTIRHLAQLYAGLFYIDGNDEHREHYDDLDASYQDLQQQLNEIPGVVYLQNNVVIVEGVALVATNGWWTYTFNPKLDYEQSVRWFMDYADVSHTVAVEIIERAYHDAAYLHNSVKRLQKHPDIKSIVMITHTVPVPELVNHDVSIVDSYRFNCLGNQHLQVALDEDYENKIKVWCFGHYHLSIDRDLGDIRYVSNPRGRYGSQWYQTAYYPKRIEV